MAFSDGSLLYGLTPVSKSSRFPLHTISNDILCPQKKLVNFVAFPHVCWEATETYFSQWKKKMKLIKFSKVAEKYVEMQGLSHISAAVRKS